MATLSDRLKAMNAPVSNPVGPIRHMQTPTPAPSFFQDLFGGVRNPTGTPLQPAQTPLNPIPITPRQPQQSVQGVPVTPQVPAQIPLGGNPAQPGQNPNFQYTSPTEQYPAGYPIIPREPGQGPMYFDPVTGQRLTGPKGQPGTQVHPEQPNFTPTPASEFAKEPKPDFLQDTLEAFMTPYGKEVLAAIRQGKFPGLPSIPGLGGVAGQAGGAGGGGGDGFKQVPVLDERSIQALAQLQPEVLKQLLGSLQQQSFEPIRREATRRFAEDELPALAERLNMLSGGQQRGSSANAFLGGAQANLASQLAAMEQQFGAQRLPQLANLFQTTLTPTFETAYFPQAPGFLQEIAPAAGEVGTQVAATWLVQNWPWLSKLFKLGAAAAL